MFRLLHIIIVHIPHRIFIHAINFFCCLFVVFVLFILLGFFNFFILNLFKIIIWLMISIVFNVFFLLINFGGFSWSNGNSVELLDWVASAARPAPQSSNRRLSALSELLDNPHALKEKGKVGTPGGSYYYGRILAAASTLLPTTLS